MMLAQALSVAKKVTTTARLAAIQSSVGRFALVSSSAVHGTSTSDNNADVTLSRRRAPSSIDHENGMAAAAAATASLASILLASCQTTQCDSPSNKKDYTRSRSRKFGGNLGNRNFLQDSRLQARPQLTSSSSSTRHGLNNFLGSSNGHSTSMHHGAGTQGRGFRNSLFTSSSALSSSSGFGANTLLFNPQQSARSGQRNLIDLTVTDSSDRSSLHSGQSMAASKSNGAASKRKFHDFESRVTDSEKTMTSTKRNVVAPGNISSKSRSVSKERNVVAPGNISSKSRRVSTIELLDSSDSESDNDGQIVSHTSKRRCVSTDYIPSSKKRPENDRSIGSTYLAAASNSVAKRSRDQVSKDETIELDSYSDSDDGWISNSKKRLKSDSWSVSRTTKQPSHVSIGSTSLAAAAAAAAADSSLKVITSKSKGQAKDRSSSSLLVDSDAPLTKRPHVSVTTSTSLTRKPASRAKSASTKAGKPASRAKSASTKAEAKAKRKSSEEEKHGLGPFRHLYTPESIKPIHKFMLEMAELHNSLKGTEFNHFDGFYPYISFEELQDEATITGLASCAHPLFFQTIMSPKFNAPFMSDETFSALETATLSEGRISDEYQVVLSELPKTHCNKELKHQTDASKFAESCSGAYIKAHVGELGDFKSTARTYLRSEQSKHDKKLPAFLQKALARHESLGTRDDDTISFQYVGTTSRPFNVRWIEHDSGDSHSLNSEFFRIFAKNYQMPLMWSQSGDIGGSEMVEGFVAGLIQMATLRTLLQTDPEANFAYKGNDGTSLTLAIAGMNVEFGQGSKQVVAYLKSMVAQGRGNTRLSSLNHLPPFIASFMDYNMDAIISYSSSNMVHSNGKRNTSFEKRFNRKLETPAEVLEESTADTLLSFCGHLAGEKWWENKMKQAAKQGIDPEEFKSDFGNKLYSAKLDKKMATNPTLSIEQAKSQIAAPAVQARKDSIDRKYNRKSDVEFACLRCAKVGVVSHRLNPVGGTHPSGLQKGLPKLGNKKGSTCPNKECKRHQLWIAVEEKEDVAKLKTNTMPDWIQSLCDNNMCSEADCYNKRAEQHGKYHYDKCEKHMGWR
jgi:hypothetical protein